MEKKALSGLFDFGSFPTPYPLPGLWGGLSGSLEQWNKEASEKLQEPV